MKTILLTLMQKKPTSDGLTFRASETRPAAVVEPPSQPVRNNLRYLAGFMLVGAAVLGHMSPAHANHVVTPFGIHCDSVGSGYCLRARR
jgi:hypothetical protein